MYQETLGRLLDHSESGDVLNGEAVNAKLLGNSGRDTLTGGTGADACSGGSGADTDEDDTKSSITETGREAQSSGPGSSSLGPSPCPDSPECVEGEFSEVDG